MLDVLDYSVAVFEVGAVEPVLPGDARERLRIDDTDNDQDLASNIEQARIQVESDTRRCFLSHTFDFKYDSFPCGSFIRLPRSPLSSVTHLKYIDTSGTLTTWGVSNYEVDTARDTIWRAWNVDWPSARDIQNAVQIRAVFGHAATDEILKLARRAILLLVGHAHENREPVIVGTISKEIELSYTSIINSITKRSYP